MSEVLIFESTNPQYDDRLIIELQVQYMKIPSVNLGRTCRVHKLFLMFSTIFVHNSPPHVLQKEELLTKIHSILMIKVSNYYLRFQVQIFDLPLCSLVNSISKQEKIIK